jgi:hypothetical protein
MRPEMNMLARIAFSQLRRESSSFQNSVNANALISKPISELTPFITRV